MNVLYASLCRSEEKHFYFYAINAIKLMEWYFSLIMWISIAFFDSLVWFIDGATLLELFSIYTISLLPRIVRYHH